ncbi:DUF2798 domain-containing protein [Massilia sp. DD77]|uniref:DUF2798 domain-containing protein n=1 Tax=Massilia sp. DD77 TaxID=3109349 RepID=UPI002FFF8378
MIPKKYAPQLFAFILSGQMSLVITGVATWRALGWTPDFGSQWLGAWLTAWVIAFPTVLLLSPPARIAVRILTSER